MITHTERQYANHVAQRAAGQVMGVFPMLDVLDCCTSIPTLVDPRKYLGWLKQFGRFTRGAEQPKLLDPKTLPPNYNATRCPQELLLLLLCRFIFTAK